MQNCAGRIGTSLQMHVEQEKHLITYRQLSAYVFKLCELILPTVNLKFNVSDNSKYMYGKMQNLKW